MPIAFEVETELVLGFKDGARGGPAGEENPCFRPLYCLHFLSAANFFLPLANGLNAFGGVTFSINDCRSTKGSRSSSKSHTYGTCLFWSAANGRHGLFVPLENTGLQRNEDSLQYNYLVLPEETKHIFIETYPYYYNLGLQSMGIQDFNLLLSAEEE